MQGPGLDARVDLSGLGFVVFARDRPRPTSELIAYLAQAARGFVVYVFDNGEVPLDLRLGSELMASVHHSYSMGGFVSQHGEAAREVDTEFVMLLDDDSFPAPRGIEMCMKALRRGKEIQAAHGSVGTFSQEGVKRSSELLRDDLDDVSCLSHMRRRRLQHHFGTTYRHRYWYAVHRREKFSAIFSLLEEVKKVDRWHSTTELVLEALTIWDGLGRDVGQVTVWDNLDNLSHYKESGAASLTAEDYWLSLRYRRRRAVTYRAIARHCRWTRKEQRDFKRAIRSYARGCKTPTAVRLGKVFKAMKSRFAQRQLLGAVPLARAVLQRHRVSEGYHKVPSEGDALDELLGGPSGSDIRSLTEFLAGRRNIHGIVRDDL